MVETTRQLLKDSKAARWTALVLLASTMFFAYMFVDILSPVKGMLERDLGWSSTAFGYYGGSEFFLNVFIGFLILAGVILDKMGIRFTAILSGSLMVVGAAIKYYALTESFQGTALDVALGSWWPELPGSCKMACIGFMIFGTGCEMGGITVSKAIVKWFKGKELATAMGAEMAIARLGVAASALLAPRIYEWEFMGSTGVSRPVLFTLILLCVGLFSFIVYAFQDLKFDREMGQQEQEAEEPFRFSDLGKVATSAPFWVIALLCVTYYSAIFPFQKYAIDMLSSSLGMTEKDAGLIFFWFPLGAAAITPILGSYMDYKGRGISMLMLGAVLMLLTHLTFAFLPQVFGTGALGVTVAITAIVVLGISFSLVPAALWPSVPKIIPDSYLGSAYAAIFWIQNWGLMGFPIIIGKVLDKTNKSPEEIKAITDAGGTYVTNYKEAMLCFACLGIVALILGLVLKRMDKKHNYGLQLPNREKAA